MVWSTRAAYRESGRGRTDDDFGLLLPSHAAPELLTCYPNIFQKGMMSYIASKGINFSGIFKQHDASEPEMRQLVVSQK